MKRLQISSVSDLTFGVHRDRTIDDLSHDFVCILGPNESGKSTLAEFLQWMIAGPGGDTASAGRFGDPAARIGGRLLGTLESESLDLTATFTLKGNGVPNDSRQGRVGDRTCDSASLSTLFGQLTAADYRLIHRLRGVDLGDSGEAKSFSDVFTRFAIGSDAAGVNPRERLSELQKREKAVAKALKDVRTTLKDIRAQIVAAEHRPDELVQLNAQLEAEVLRRSQLGRQLDELRAHEALYRRALEFIPVREQRAGAEIALGQIGPMTDAWRQVARSQDAVIDVHSKVQAQEETVQDCGRRFDQARAESGVEASALEGHELSNADRRLLRDAAQAVISADAAVNGALVRQTTLGAQIIELEAEIARTAGVLGVEPETGESLLGRATSIRSLLSETALWADEDRKATEYAATVAGLQSRLETASAAQPPTAQAGARSFPPRLIVALGGLVLAAASALVNPLVAVAVAVIAVLVALIVPDGPTAVTTTSGDATEPIRKALAEANENLARSQARSSELKDSLMSSLAAFGASSVMQASLARTHVEQLAELAARVDTLTLDRATLGALEDEITGARAEASEAQTELQVLLRDRDIVTVPPIDGFLSWLEGYELALSAARDLREASKVLQSLESEREELIGVVLDELGDLNWPARIERIRVMHDQLLRMEAQEKQRQEAELKIGFLGDDRERIEEILRSHGDATALEAQLAEVGQQIGKLDGERDEGLTRSNSIKVQIETLEATELLADLHAQRGELEEAEFDLSNDLEVLVRSALILAEVIDRFEVENQDPLFKQTQLLVQRVVPDWGDLIFSRNAKSDVVIERRDASSRLEDSRLSDGARALLYLALRLAFTNADAERRNIALPILCDDPLVHLDDNRRTGAIALLADAAQTHQVVLFTCDTATASLAQQTGAHVITI